MKNKLRTSLIIVNLLLFLFILSSLAQAGSIKVNVTETNINSTVLFTGGDFLPNYNYTLAILLQNQSAWWDGYQYQWGTPGANISTNSSGGFSFNWTIPFDFRVSEGWQTVKFGESIGGVQSWSVHGVNWSLALPTKNSITGDSDPNGFVYTASNAAAANAGGIEKFYKFNGSFVCSYNMTHAANFNEVTNNDTYLYAVTSTVSNNLYVIRMSDCARVANITTSGGASTNIRMSSDKSFMIIGYSANMSARKFIPNNGTPSNVTAFNPININSVANDICITPDNQYVYIGYANGNITKLNSTNGSIIWQSNPYMFSLNFTYQFPVNGLGCDNDNVYVARSGVTVAGIVAQGFVDSLNGTNGSVNWIAKPTYTPYDGANVISIRCQDSTYCYAVKVSPTITTGIAGSTIFKINKSDGSIVWWNWDSWLSTIYKAPYGNGSTHSQAQRVWSDNNTEQGYIYIAYNNSWVQKVAKSDVNASIYPSAGFWVRGSTNYWNYIADVPKNIWLSNETPYYVFRHWNQFGVPLNVSDNIAMTGTFFRFSMLNTFNSFTASEYTVSNILGNSLFIDPVIQTSLATTNQKNAIQMFNYTFQTNCPVYRYSDYLAGWHYEDRSCHYEEIKANATGWNIGTTINGTFMAATVYSLIKTKFWEQYPITKYYGNDNWAWGSFYNTTNNQVLGFATEFGSDQDTAYGNEYGRSTLFVNNGTYRFINFSYRADTNRKTDNYLFFLPKGGGGGDSGDYLWSTVDIETQEIAIPINITLANTESDTFIVNSINYSSRINFTAQEPNLFNRTNEPVEIVFNATGIIRSNCADVVITDNSDNQISLWEVDNSTLCTQNQNVSVWIMMNWTKNETKNLKIYYGNSTAVPMPAGSTDLFVGIVSGTCALNNQTLTFVSNGWYNWTAPAAANIANETTKFGFNDTVSTLWQSLTHYGIAQCYKNSNATGTGVGAATDTCSTPVIPLSRCLTVGGTGKIFAKLNATANLGAIPNRGPGVANTVNMEYYFFAGNGRIRITTKLQTNLSIMNTTVSKNWPPYYYFSIRDFVPPSSANGWIYYSGLYEQMKKPVATFNVDYTEANLSAGPLPLLFTIEYGDLNNVSQDAGGILRPSTLSGSFWNTGCTAHKMWQYYSYNRNGPATYGTSTAPLYVNEFISCSQYIQNLLPKMGESGYVNVIPEMSWYGTTVNRYYDPFLVGKFYLKPNLWRPYNRENKFQPPYSTNSPYSTTGSKISSYIIPKCPIKEDGYTGYNDFLQDLPNLLANSSLLITTNRVNISCAAQIIKFSDNRGSDATQIIFARNLSVVVGETVSAGWTYPINTFAPGTYNLQADGALDLTFTQKSSITNGYYGKWYFTYTPYNYVMYTLSTSGGPQFNSTPSSTTTAATSYTMRYFFGPDMLYQKRVFDMNELWNYTKQNFTYYLNPCYLGNYQASYGSTILITPGWQLNNLGAAAQTCPRNEYNKEIYASFRPGFTSLYPTNALNGYQFELALDGRMNFAGNGTPPGAVDTYYISRHNALWDDLHSDDYNSIMYNTSDLDQGSKHYNKQPWYCQTSDYMNRSFCVVSSSTSSLVYNYNPGGGLTTANSWSAYWQPTSELTMFEDWYQNRWFDTSSWQWNYNHYLSLILYPSLSSNEMIFSNLLMVSNNSEDYKDWFDKPFPFAYSTFKQNQFLLDDWTQKSFIVFDRDAKIYSPGQPFNITGLIIYNRRYLNNTNITLKIYRKDGDSLMGSTTTITDNNAMFIWNYTLPTRMSSGVHYVNVEYNNSFNDSTPFMMTNLVATITNNKAAFEREEYVFSTVTVKDSLTDTLINPNRLELRYIDPAPVNAILACAKYPSTANITNCPYNLTMTNTGTYTYNFSVGNGRLGTYTIRATVTNDNIAADYTTQFVLALIDLCKANGLYNYALNYPLQYNLTTDTLNVIGNSTFGSSNNPMTFDKMYEFGQATRGTCIIDKPANGTFIVKSRLIIGNGTQNVYVTSKGESISFSSQNMSQLVINNSAHLILGNVLNNIPQEGSTVKFTSQNDGDILVDVSGELALYDCYVTDTGSSWGKFIYRGACGNLGNGTYSSLNSSVTIKKTIFDRAARGQFLYTSNVTIDDMKINRINSSSSAGYGIIASCDIPALNNIQIYHQDIEGSGIKTTEDMPQNTDLTIQNSIFQYNLKDVIATKDGRNVQLINTQWSRLYGFNWTGSWTGRTDIKESYGYLPTIKDTSSNTINNTQLILVNRYGDEGLNINTNESGTIAEQNIPTWQVEKTTLGEEVSSFNPYTFYIRKYGKTFISEPKSFAVRTIEIKQMTNNPFTSLNETPAKQQTGIIYNTPLKVRYSDAETEFVDTDDSIFLNNIPVVQSEFFGLYDNSNGNTIPSSDYTVNYATGNVTFINGYGSTTVRAVYSYGGSITIIGNKTLSNIYDYLQANLSNVFTTETGSIYNSYVNIIIGNSTDIGTIRENSELTLNFKNGFGFSSDNDNSSSVNIQSDTWNFTWIGNVNETFSRKYGFDLKVVYENGTAMKDAKVIIKTLSNNVILNITTNSSGTIPHQEISYSTYQSQNGSLPDIYSPYTVEITKSGYISSSGSVVIDSIKDLSYTLYKEADPCSPDDNYNYALYYPMTYNNTLDVITVIGNSTFGSSDNKLTFEDVYKFARATKGSCIMQRPATGNYAVLSKMILGNGTQPVYLTSKGEAIGFSSGIMPQFTVNKNAHISFGGVIDGIPQEGSSIKFTSNNTNDILLDVAGGELAFYDSYIGDVGTTWGRFMYRGSCGITSEETSTLNSSITIKKSIFDRAARGQFFFTGNVTIDDMKLNRINSSAADGYGIVSGCQLPALNNLQIYHQEQNGSGIFITDNTPNNVDVVITNSIFQFNNKDIIAYENGKGAQLINTQWGRTYGFNWSGTWDGTTAIKESYGYKPSFEDISAVRLENVSVIATDEFGNVYLALLSNSTGEIPEQSIPTWQVQKNPTSESILLFNPYSVMIKQYGKKYITEAKSFSSRTIETKQLGTNNFVVTSIPTLLSFKNVEYKAPNKIAYGDEVNSSWEMSGNLKNYPVDSCQYFAIFANGSKLVSGVDYVINYQTGGITFISNMSGKEIKPVYYAYGNITLTNGLSIPFSLDEIYDWMQYQTYKNNLSEELTTADGINYNFCVDLYIGNATEPGYIQSAQKAVSFNTGYDLRFISGKVDLAGVGGSGSVQYIEVAKPDIRPGRTQFVYMSLTNNIGQPLSGKTIRADVYYPNGTIWLGNQYFSEYIEGVYKLSFNIPSDLVEYGTYAVHLKDAYSTIRTFNVIPSSDIVVRGPPSSTGDYFSWLDARIFNRGLWIESQGTIINNLDEDIALGQTDLYEGNYFISMLKDFDSQYNTWYVSELNTSTQLIIDFKNLSEVNIAGDVLNATILLDDKPYSSNAIVLNLTVNLTGKNKFVRLKLNFSAININYSFWDEETNFDLGVKFSSDYYDQSIDGNIERIAFKMMTDENNYYIQNTTLRYWQIQYPNSWAELQPYYDSEFTEIVGNPDPTNISSIEGIIYIRPSPISKVMQLELFNPTFDRYSTLRYSQLGKKSQGNYNTLFWWDSDGKYTLSSHRERKFYAGLESPYLHEAEVWETQYPNDAYVISKIADIKDAQFYWEQYAAYQSIQAYLAGNPGQNLFIISSLAPGYSRNDTANVDILTTDRMGNLISANVTVNVTYPNASLLYTSNLIETSVGRYNYNFVVPNEAPNGDYSVLIQGGYVGYNATEVKVFRVSTSTSSGGSYPTIELLASTPIATSTIANIGALVKSSSGIITNCDGNLGITIRNLADGSSSDGTMANFGTGMYNYSWITPSKSSVFYVNASCSISGTSYTGFTILSTQSVVATASVDYNQIALYVWNYTSRDLTYYNQSVSESVQSCLKDGQCSGWWLNNTLSSLHNTINEINSTANSIKIDTLSLLNNINCISSNEICTRLTYIINNATDIQSRVYSLNTSQIPTLQNSLGNVYLDTQYIRLNMATAAGIQDLNNTILLIKNNMITQSMFEGNLSDIRTRLVNMNDTIISTYSYLNNIITNKLDTINSTINTVRDEAIANNLSIQSKLDNIQSNVTWLFNNVATLNAMNANFTDLRNRISDINTTLIDIRNNINCTNPSNSQLCTYLNNLNSTANSIYSGMATQSFLQQVAMNISYIKDNMATYSQVQNITNNTEWIINNVATSAEMQNNFTNVINRLIAMNNTLLQVYNQVIATNQTLSQQISDTQINISWLINNVATSAEMQNNFSDVLNKLYNINITTTQTNSYLYGSITKILTEMNTTSYDSYLYLQTNGSSSANLTELLNSIMNINNNLTYIKNNMFYQGNATNAFLVDYVASPYIEPGYREELWVLTKDLLGNPKTVSAAECNILKNGSYVDNGTVSISSGGVHAYWNVASDALGEYYWNCTLTGSTLNLRVPFFVASTASTFKVTSLVAGSPRYANEEVLIEAVFNGQGGSSITPDTINLTIYDKNGNIWTNANKSSFTKLTDDIWRYSKSIESNPTTGMYTAHLTAAYQGIQDTKSVQFRIATGGPYKVYLDCPSTSNIGENLVCNVILQDEGEVGTESTSTVWVDTNNNGVLDSGEPSLSFSKKTTPLQNVTESVSINVPSSHPNGLFLVRVDTSYSGSSQPNSGASDSVTLQGNSTTPITPPTGGSTGGSVSGLVTYPINQPTAVEGSGKIQIVDYPDKIKINTEETKNVSVLIKNIGEGTLHNVKLLISGLPLDSYSVSPKILDLSSKALDTFNLDFGPFQEAKQYIVKFVVSSDEDTKESSFILTVEAQKTAKEEVPSGVKYSLYSLILWILLILIIVILMIYGYKKYKKSQEGKRPYASVHRTKKLKKQNSIFNLTNVILLIFIAVLAVSLFFKVPLKNIALSSVNSIGSINFSPVNINWWIPLVIIIAIIMLGIFIVLMRILKELRNKDRTIYKNKNTHQINQSKSNRNESKDDYRNDARIRLIKRNQNIKSVRHNNNYKHIHSRNLHMIEIGNAEMPNETKEDFSKLINEKNADFKDSFNQVFNEEKINKVSKINIKTKKISTISNKEDMINQLKEVYK